MRKYGKVDGNQTEIVTALRKLGFSVAITSSLGDGFPDLVVAGHIGTILVELKDGSKPPSQQKLTLAEIKFKESWKGVVITANCLDDILNAFKLKR